ncbi:MAG: DNA polymerase III subunit beta [Clostridia bacterium]|nr:DNA polymerase III subunit beta [Clostridia bacterium]
MRVICEGLDLSDAVLKVIKATAVRTTNPILEGIKLHASEDTLTLSATDLEISIEKTIPADVKIAGDVVVPGKFFADFVKKLSNEQIELSSTEQGTLKIRYTDSEGYLQLLNAEEFPIIKTFDESDYFVVSKFDFRDAIDKTIFAVALDDARPILKGCKFEIAGGEMTVAALDGFRIAQVKHKLINSSKDMEFVIPARCLAEVSKLIDGEDEELKIHVSDNYLLVNLGSTNIMTRKLEGEFINYKNALGTASTTEIIVNKRQLEYGLERASLLARFNTNNLVKFDIRDKLLTMTSSSDIGNVTEKITISLDGKDLVIAFNARYIADCLRNIQEEYIKMSFASSIYPCTITSPENNSYLFVVFPVRLMGE